MANRPVTIIAVALVLVAAGAGGYLVWRSNVTAPIVGVVRLTEIRVAPEVSGQITSIKVRKGDRVRAGEVVAELSAIEISASVAQARAALDAAVANRDNVYAGVRAEEVASLAASPGSGSPTMRRRSSLAPPLWRRAITPRSRISIRPRTT